MQSTGVSIIILTKNGAHHLKTLLETFFKNNTHDPVELIVIDHGSTDNTADIVANYVNRAMIRLVRKLDRDNFAASCNFGAQKAHYPLLLFLNNDIVYTSDMLPRGVEILEDDTMGVVGCRLDDVPGKNPQKTPQKIQHTGIDFQWDEKKQFHRPIQIRHASLEAAAKAHGGVYPAVTGAFMLCRKADFQKIGGFCEEYDYGFEDIDFCLRVGRDLKKKCFCINGVSLQHLEGATRNQAEEGIRNRRYQNNDALFKKRLDQYIANTIVNRKPNEQAAQSKTPPSSPDASQKAVQTSPHEKKPFDANKKGPLGTTENKTSDTVGMNILYVLYNAIDSNGGIHVQLHAERLMAQYPQCDCRFVMPNWCLSADAPPDAGNMGERVVTFSQATSKGSTFSDGRGPDIIHAWTPREIVRKCCENLLSQSPVPLIIHLEDNEEYLTEVTVGRPFADLAKLPVKELDALIPDSRYHPIRGRDFLGKAQGVTMIIDTLAHFNPANLPGMLLPPPVDERLFYPRPLNMKLREELKIPKNNIVLAYTGNVHAANRDEVRELYKAVHLLNEQGHPTVLIRTGKNAVKLGDEKWLTVHEKHLGWVARSKVPEVLAAADVLVQPGEPGAFNDQRVPSKLPEFFAMGRPVVLSKTNLGVQLEHQKNAYVLNKSDADEIVKAVIKIHEDRAIREELAIQAVFFCRNTINSRVISKNYFSLYELVKKTQ